VKVIDLIAKTLEHEAVWELIDHLVIERLKESRQLFITDRDRLNNIRNTRELRKHEQDDWYCLVLDIQALERVIDLYDPNYLENQTRGL
jgi:hypothetical protein